MVKAFLCVSFLFFKNKTMMYLKHDISPDLKKGESKWEALSIFNLFYLSLDQQNTIPQDSIFLIKTTEKFRSFIVLVVLSDWHVGDKQILGLVQE